jgi:hypothetical protein
MILNWLDNFWCNLQYPVSSFIVEVYGWTHLTTWSCIHVWSSCTEDAKQPLLFITKTMIERMRSFTGIYDLVVETLQSLKDLLDLRRHQLVQHVVIRNVLPVQYSTLELAVVYCVMVDYVVNCQCRYVCSKVIFIQLHLKYWMVSCFCRCKKCWCRRCVWEKGAKKNIKVQKLQMVPGKCISRVTNAFGLLLSWWGMCGWTLITSLGADPSLLASCQLSPILLRGAVRKWVHNSRVLRSFTLCIIQIIKHCHTTGKLFFYIVPTETNIPSRPLVRNVTPCMSLFLWENHSWWMAHSSGT